MISLTRLDWQIFFLYILINHVSDFYDSMLLLFCFQVHSLFSMLGLNHAYVTAIGRIIGVVALKEVSIFFHSINSTIEFINTFTIY